MSPRKPKLQEVADATKVSKKTREEALATAIRACRLMEKTLQAALDGEPLRGLPNLGAGSRPQHLERIRRREDDAVDQLDPKREELCLSVKGELVMAKLGASRPVRDDELVASDAQDFAYTVVMVADAHVAAATDTQTRYAALLELNERLERVLKGEES